MTTKDVEIVTGMFRESDDLLIDATGHLQSGNPYAAEDAEHEARQFDAVGIGALMCMTEREE